MPLLTTLADLAVQRGKSSAVAQIANYISLANNTVLTHNAAGSTTGNSWFSLTDPTSSFTAYTYNGAAYNNNTYVFVAGDSNIYVTTDKGSTWSTYTPITSIVWNSVIYANSLFVAVGYKVGSAQSCATSTDGITWTARTMPSSNRQWSSVVWNGSNYIAVASAFTQTATSTNGTTWVNGAALSAAITSPKLLLGGLPSNAGTLSSKIIAIPSGASTTSFGYTINNGTNWTTGTLPLNFSGQTVRIAYGAGVFLIMGGYNSPYNQYYYSNDGVNWGGRLTQAPASGEYTWIPFFTGSKFIIVSGSTSNSTVLQSIDGINWTSAGDMPLKDGWSVIAGPSNDTPTFASLTAFQANTTGTTAVVSNDLSANFWSSITSTSTTANRTVSGKGITILYTAGSTALVSSDGITWTTSTGANNLINIAFHNGVFFGVNGASNTGFRSSDGITWSAASMPTGTWSFIANGLGGIIALTASGNQTYSTDGGTTWVATFSSTITGTVVSLAGNNFGFLALTSGSTSYWTSQDVTGGWGSRVFVDMAVRTTAISLPLTNGNASYGLYAYSNTSMAKASNNTLFTGPSTPVPTAPSQVFMSKYNFVAKSNTANGTYYVGRTDATWNSVSLPSSATQQVLAPIYKTSPINILSSYVFDSYYYTAISNDGVYYEEGNNPFTSNCYYEASATLYTALPINSTGVYYTSTDGFSWTRRSFATTGTYTTTKLSFVNNMFMFFDTTGKRVYSSADGITWTTSNALAITTDTIDATKSLFAFGSNTYVFLTNIHSFTSTDRISWTSNTLPATITWAGVTFLTTNNTFVASDTAVSTKIWKSSNGTTWTGATVSGLTSATLLIGNGSTVLVFPLSTVSSVYRSSDGIVWTTTFVEGPTFSSSNTARTGGYGAIGYIVAKDTGPTSTASDLMYSADGISWCPLPYLNSVAGSAISIAVKK